MDNKVTDAAFSGNSLSVDLNHDLKHAVLHEILWLFKSQNLFIFLACLFYIR